MKNLKLVLIGFILLFGGYNSAKAQVVELPVDNNVYVYDAAKCTIENKSTFSKVYAMNRCDSYNIANNDFSSIYKKAFSSERIKELAKDKRAISILLYADSSGNIVKILFFLKNAAIPIVSLSEIKALEDAFKDYKLEIRDKCDGVAYYMFTGICRFNLLL